MPSSSLCRISRSGRLLAHAGAAWDEGRRAWARIKAGERGYWCYRQSRDPLVGRSSAGTAGAGQRPLLRNSRLPRETLHPVAMPNSPLPDLSVATGNCAPTSCYDCETPARAQSSSCCAVPPLTPQAPSTTPLMFAARADCSARRQLSYTTSTLRLISVSAPNPARILQPAAQPCEITTLPKWARPSKYR
jgi:hypothetical protein